MKRWALVTIVLYLLLLVALTVPLIAAMTWDGSGGGNMSKGSLWASVAEALGSAEEAYEEIWYWIILGILGACQGMLFIVPIRDVLRRPHQEASPAADGDYRRIPDCALMCPSHGMYLPGGLRREQPAG